MFGGRAENRPQAKIGSLVGAGAKVEGDIRFTGGLRVDGEVKGCVLAAEGAQDATLVLSESARIEGSVKVAHFVTNGTVVGNVEVLGALELQPRARIVGDVAYARIEMHQGAVIEGRLTFCGEQKVELVDNDGA